MSRTKLLLPLLLVLLAFTGTAAPRPVEARGSALSEAASWLQRYLRIDTTNPPGNEAQAVAFLAGVLHREGIATETYLHPTGRASLVARIDGSSPEAGDLLLLHHVDVVPAGPGWSVPPFEGRVQDGRLWGRGAVDAKSLGIAHLAALVDLARRSRKTGERPHRGVVFLAVADEEAGGAAGSRWLLDTHPELFDGVRAVWNEGGFNRNAQGEPTWWGIEVAQKRPLWMEVTARGRQGHGSGWNPGNANHLLLRALARLVDAPPRYRVDEPVRRYLEAVAPYQNDYWRPIFENIEGHITAAGPRGALMPGMANLFLDTAQVTVLEAGERINVIPGEARARIDVRLLPDTDEQAYLRQVEALLGGDVQVEVLLQAPRAEPSPTDTAAYRVLERTLGGEAPVVPAMISGFTDSRYFREHGIPAYGVSPFLVEAEDLLGIHGTDERIPLEAFDAGVERMKRLVRGWAFP